MTDDDLPLLGLLVVALLLAVFLAAAEASLLRVSEFRIKSRADAGEPRAERLAELLAHLPRVLNLILFLALLSQIGAATITGVLAQRWFGNIGVTIASILLTIVMFIYGEAIPKTYAVRHAERTALGVAPVIAMLERALSHLVSLLVWIADIQLPGRGITISPTVTEDELRLLTVRAAHEGEITDEDRALIERAFRFGDRRADDIMVPRPDIVAIESNATIDEGIDVGLESGHRRLPVYEESLENVIGIVRLQDMVRARDQGLIQVETLIEEPLVVPESIPVTSLLTEMQEKGTHLAILVDEYGITVGVVTIEDVAEELLGTISEQPGSPSLSKVGPGEWLADGAMPVEGILDEVGLEAPEGEWNTLAGMMIGLAGRLLEQGESVEVAGLELTVDSVSRRRITRVRMTRLESFDQGEDQE